MEIGFIDHFNTRLVTTLNYGAIADFRTLQTAPAHTKSFPACFVFTSRPLITASNSGDSSAFKMDLRDIRWDGMDWIDLA
jgi:hypothetical protein